MESSRPTGISASADTRYSAFHDKEAKRSHEMRLRERTGSHTGPTSGSGVYFPDTEINLTRLRGEQLLPDIDFIAACTSGSPIVCPSSIQLAEDVFVLMGW